MSPQSICRSSALTLGGRLRKLSLPFAALGLFALFESSVPAATTTIFVVDFDFTSSIGGPHFNPTINLGDDVHWVWDNANLAEHSTTAAGGQSEFWDSGLHSAPFTFDHVFTHEGTFGYYCLLHGFDAGGGNVGGMSGEITVVPEPGPVAILAFGGFLLFLARHLRGGAPRARC